MRFDAVQKEVDENKRSAQQKVKSAALKQPGRLLNSGVRDSFLPGAATQLVGVTKADPPASPQLSSKLAVSSLVAAADSSAPIGAAVAASAPIPQRRLSTSTCLAKDGSVGSSVEQLTQEMSLSLQRARPPAH